MSVIATALKHMLAAGMPHDEIVAAVAEMEAMASAPKTSRQERNARYYQNKRLKASEIKTDKTISDVSDASKTLSDAAAPRTCAQVVTPSSSLRSEGTQEANASFVDAPSAKSTPAPPEKPKTKPPKVSKGTRLPDDWEPSADEFEMGRDAGLTDQEIHRAALEFRNYWCSRSRDAAKLSWRLTWHNRVLELGERKQRNGARLATAAGQPGTGRRGASTFADLYVQRHGTGSG